jgi:hypothetical protein
MQHRRKQRDRASDQAADGNQHEPKAPSSRDSRDQPGATAFSPNPQPCGDERKEETVECDTVSGYQKRLSDCAESDAADTDGSDDQVASSRRCTQLRQDMRVDVPRPQGPSPCVVFGNPASSVSPVALRPRLTTGLPLSIRLRYCSNPITWMTG